MNFDEMFDKYMASDRGKDKAAEWLETGKDRRQYRQALKRTKLGLAQTRESPWQGEAEQTPEMRDAALKRHKVSARAQSVTPEWLAVQERTITDPAFQRAYAMPELTARETEAEATRATTQARTQQKEKENWLTRHQIDMEGLAAAGDAEGLKAKAAELPPWLQPEAGAGPVEPANIVAFNKIGRSVLLIDYLIFLFAAVIARFLPREIMKFRETCRGNFKNVLIIGAGSAAEMGRSTSLRTSCSASCG